MQFRRKCSARSSVAMVHLNKGGVLLPPRGISLLRKLVRPQFLAGNCGDLKQFFASKPREAGGIVVVGLVFLLLLPTATFAQVVISEIMYDAPGSDSHAEWIELQNTGDSAVDISKWKLNDGSNHVFNQP